MGHEDHASPSGAREGSRDNAGSDRRNAERPATRTGARSGRGIHHARLRQALPRPIRGRRHRRGTCPRTDAIMYERGLPLRRPRHRYRADVAQPVERQVSTLEVEGSNPFVRSNFTHATSSRSETRRWLRGQWRSPAKRENAGSNPARRSGTKRMRMIVLRTNHDWNGGACARMRKHE